MGEASARTLALAGLAAFFVSFDSAVLVLALPAIAADFRTPVTELTRVGSALTLGAVAALPIAMQADRVGRRRLLVLSVAGFSLTNLASAWSPSVAWLAASRVVAVCFETVAAGTATALVIEEVRPGQRGLAVAGLTVAAGAGAGLTTVLYPLLAPHWRTLYLLGGAGLAGAVVLALLLPESRAWAASVGVERQPRLPLRVLLEPPWRARLALVTAAAVLGALLYSPAGLLSALFGSRDLGLSPALISAVMLVSGLASVPAFLVGGRLSDRFGRRWLGAGLGTLTALATAATFAGGRPAYWVGSMLWSILASTSVPVLGAWYGELFPTRARATSESVSALAGAVGGATGFQLVGLLQPWLGLGHALAIIATGALLGAALLLLLPETGGEPLSA
ncbi:MAG TPA: MFS transporter [Candidatus Dormibacteraeota bacterium]